MMSHCPQCPGVTRVVSHFSCGATSAVATWMALHRYPREKVVIVNAYIKEEHKDNRRFLHDCEKWFNHPITVLVNEAYNGSTHEVWRRGRFIKGREGAPCSKRLKRDLLDSFSMPGDIHIIGYDLEEQDRFDRFVDANNGMRVVCPLIEECLTKPDCLAIVQRAGIELPEMYKLGFHNANCIGCPKGGLGYWNKIKQHFPQQFYQIADIQESIGPGANFLRNNTTGERISLRELTPDQGNFGTELEVECSYFCELVEKGINK